MKKTLSIVLITTILIVALVVGLSAILVSGEPVGTAVTSTADFAAMSADGQYYLTADIEVSATYETEFTGTFDGNGYKVTTSVPLFASVSGTVKNITVEGAVSLETGDAAAVALSAKTGATFTDVTNNAAVSGSVNVGGIIAVIAEDSTITIDNCDNTGAIVGGSANNQGVGGIVGINISTASGFAITNCTNAGAVSTSVTKQVSVGGIIGRDAGTNSTISNCTNQGNITGGWVIGGIVGYAENPLVIDSCLNDENATVSGTGTKGYCGGIVARIGLDGSGGGSKEPDNTFDNFALIKNCINRGFVDSRSNQGGGMASYLRCSIRFENCYNYGKVSSPKWSAGIAGYSRGYYSEFINCVNYGEIVTDEGNEAGIAAGMIALHESRFQYAHLNTFKNCGNEGNITAYKYSAGIAAQVNVLDIASISVTGCYNTGTITATNGYVAGLIADINKYTDQTVSICDPEIKYNYISGTLTPAEGSDSYATIRNNIDTTYTKLGYNYIENGTATKLLSVTTGAIDFPTNYEYYFVSADLISGKLAYTINQAAENDLFFQEIGIDLYPTADIERGGVAFDGTNYYNVDVEPPVDETTVEETTVEQTTKEETTKEETTKAETTEEQTTDNSTTAPVTEKPAEESSCGNCGEGSIIIAVAQFIFVVGGAITLVIVKKK